MRSASRYGLYDFGANAARIRSLLEDIDDAVGTAPEPRPERGKSLAAQAAAGQAINAVDRRRSVGLDRPRVTRSSICASTERPAAPVSRGSMPI